MGLSVIIPSKTASNLAACLNAICGGYERYQPGPIVDGQVVAIRVPPCPEAIVIDDSDDGAVAKVCEYYEARRISSPTPFIFARNCNLGIQAAADDDVILLNDDALLKTPGGFAAMQKQADEHPEYGIIGAVTNLTGQPLQQPQGKGLREVPHLAFVCVLIPRRTIDKVGLLDERYCLDYGVEDRDYCEAVRRAGLKVAVFDHCYVDHGSLTSTFRGDPKTPRSFMQNWELFLQKWGPTAL